MAFFSGQSLKPALRFGALGGVITIIAIYTYSSLGAKAFANPSYGLVIFGILFLVNIGMAVGAALSHKQQQNGLLPFKEAVGQTFVSLGIIVVAYHAFYFLLLNVIDPGMMDKLTSIRLEQLESLKSAGEISEKTYKQQRSITEKGSLTLLDTFWLTLIWLALSFFMALILSAILRKEPQGSQDGS